VKYLLVALLVHIPLKARRDRLQVNDTQYTATLEIFLQNELNLRQLNSLWFQQDRATAH
jgi:hypothetical protein